jgi:hypothetical protein
VAEGIPSKASNQTLQQIGSMNEFLQRDLNAEQSAADVTFNVKPCLRDDGRGNGS